VGAFNHIEVDEHTFHVYPGDRVLLYTDGLIELAHPGHPTSRPHGMDQLKTASQDAAHLPLKDMVKAVAINLLGSVSAIQDDILLLGVEAP